VVVQRRYGGAVVVYGGVELVFGRRENRDGEGGVYGVEKK
jgi:hypothetical protein